MQLHRLLADKAHGLPDLVLGAGHGCATLCRRLLQLEAGVIAHGAGQLKLHLDVGHAVAQRLKTADGHTELFALVHVVHGDGQGGVHHTHGLRAGGSQPDVHRVLQRSQPVHADERGLCLGKLQLGGAAALLRDIAARADTGRRALDQKQCLPAVGHGGHHQGIGQIACGHHGLAAADVPSAFFSFSGQGRALVQPVTRGALLVRQHHQRLPGGNPGQPGRFDGVRRPGIDHSAGDQCVGQRLQHQAAAQLFHGHHGLDRAHAHAAVRLWNVQTAQAEFSEFGVSLA